MKSQIFKEIKLNDVMVHGSLYEREADRLLEGLGPRYADWWMLKPLPVDGDLLPEVIPGYMPPPRRSPPYGKSSISYHELTYLRKLAQPLPTHFVLGNLIVMQDWASAIVKLWEKTHIVKIAIKWGAQNTDNEQMARELKGLTGGVLLLQNKYLIIMYRGNLIMNRDTVLMECQLHEEDARLRAAHALNFWDTGSSTASAKMYRSSCDNQKMKTGGLVVWTKKDTLVVYRGSDSKLYSRTSKEMHRDLSNAAEAFSLKFKNIKVKSQDGKLIDYWRVWDPATLIGGC
ncbi:hypothetical protein QQ045_010722 [Rhodiola kirilowii]